MHQRFLKVTLLILCLTSICCIHAQKKIIWGFNIARQANTEINGIYEGEHAYSKAWLTSLYMDYALTHRLSFNAQLGLQIIPNRNNSFANQQKLLYREVSMGLTKYFPSWGGAFFLTSNVFAGYGTGTFLDASNNKKQLFDQPDFNNFRAGLGLYLGYIFKNGLFLNSGLQSALFTSHYSNDFVKSYDENIQILGIGVMFGTKARTKSYIKRD